MGNATSGSITDKLTREHQLTVDEARLILNVKKDDPIEAVLKVRSVFLSGRPLTLRLPTRTFPSPFSLLTQHYEHLFKVNSPPAEKPAPKPHAGRKPPPIPAYSHYLQSKVWRAKARLEAELKEAQEEQTPPPAEAPSNTSSSDPPPPPPPSGGSGSSP